MSETPLRIAREGTVVRLSLARPPLNVLDRALNRALAEAVRAQGADPEVAAIVLDGGASRGFSAGVEVADHVPGRVEGMLEDFHAAIRALWDTNCPTLAGEPVTAGRAHALGLVNRVCRAGTLEIATRQFLAPLLEKSPAVLREAKRALREGAREPQAGALARIEQRYLGGLMTLDDAHEGIRAFMEKRPPRFRNR